MSFKSIKEKMSKLTQLKKKNELGMWDISYSKGRARKIEASTGKKLSRP
jgi:hypothetical protein